jgi:hypothetical protein
MSPLIRGETLPLPMAASVEITHTLHHKKEHTR